MLDAQNIKSIVISRCDNIGDVTLTLPMAAWLKHQNPAIKIYFLARSYVKDIVEMHGGILNVESELNKGTKFIIKIPYEQRD